MRCVSELKALSDNACNGFWYVSEGAVKQERPERVGAPPLAEHWQSSVSGVRNQSKQPVLSASDAKGGDADFAASMSRR